MMIRGSYKTGALNWSISNCRAESWHFWWKEKFAQRNEEATEKSELSFEDCFVRVDKLRGVDFISNITISSMLRCKTEAVITVSRSRFGNYIVAVAIIFSNWDTERGIHFLSNVLTTFTVTHLHYQRCL